MFKVGDRVKAVRNIEFDLPKNTFGTILVINFFNEDDIVDRMGVEWDKELKFGHEFNTTAPHVNCKKNRGMWVTEDSIKLVEPSKAMTIEAVLSTISSLNIPEDIYKIINDKFMEMV